MQGLRLTISTGLLEYDKHWNVQLHMEWRPLQRRSCFMLATLEAEAHSTETLATVSFRTILIDQLFYCYHITHLPAS